MRDDRLVAEVVAEVETIDEGLRRQGDDGGRW